MTAANHAQWPKRRQKGLATRIENFPSACSVTACDEHLTVVQQRSSVSGPRRVHRRSKRLKAVLRMCGIENFRGRQRAAIACAAGNQHAAVSQNCRAMIDTRSAE